MEEMKICRRCGIEKPILDFGVSGKHNGKYKNICKACNAAYLKYLRQQNPDKMRARDRSWAAKNRDRISAKNKKRYSNPSLDKNLQMLVTTASKDRRNIKFSLSLEDIKSIWDKQNGRCVYTGLPLTPKGHQINTVSLDRIDSDGEYEPNNVQLVCVAINRMKLDHSENTFIQLCNSVTQHNKDRENLVELAITV